MQNFPQFSIFVMYKLFINELQHGSYC